MTLAEFTESKLNVFFQRKQKTHFVFYMTFPCCWSCRAWSSRSLSPGSNRRKRTTKRLKPPTCRSTVLSRTWAETRPPWWWEWRLKTLWKSRKTLRIKERGPPPHNSWQVSLNVLTLSLKVIILYTLSEKNWQKEKLILARQCKEILKFI